MNELIQYKVLLTDIKDRVRKGQLRVNFSANAEMLSTYWDIGRMIHERQKEEGWGSSVIPRLARDLKNELSEVKGFSVRNLQFMIQFYQKYSEYTAIAKPSVSQLESPTNSILQLPVAKLENKAKINGKPSVSQLKSITPPVVAELENSDFKKDLILSTKWSNHIILIQKIKDIDTRFWYMQECLKNGWSRDTLSAQIRSKLHERQGSSATNFEFTLPPAQSQLAKYGRNT